MIDISMSKKAGEHDTDACKGLMNVFRYMVNYLNEQRFNYVVLDSPSVSEEKIEFVVAQHVQRQLSRHILDFCKRYEYIPVQKIWQKNDSWHYVLSNYSDLAGSLGYYRVIFRSGYKALGRYYFSSEELLKNKSYICGGNYWKLTYAHSFSTLLICCIEYKDFGSEKFANLLESWHCSKSTIKSLLGRFFRKEQVEFISSCFDERDYSRLYAGLDSLKKELRPSFFAQIIDNLQSRINDFKAFVRPPGLVIGLLGRDGSGKSTFINEIASVFECCFTNTTAFKKHPRLFYKAPILNKNIGYHFSKPHLYKERGRVASFLKLNLLLLDFLFGYWLKVFPLKRKAYLVFYDRYFIDVLADPLRYRIKGNKYYIKAIHHLLPKPDLWIILDLPSEVLLKRKQELTFEMSEKLRGEYLKLQFELPNCIVLDNSAELKKTVSNALSFIISFMQQKFQGLC